MTPSYREPLFNNVPIVVVALAGAITLVSGAAFLGGENAFRQLILAVGLFPGTTNNLAAYPLHVFAHGGWGHLLINMGIMVAIGAAVAGRFGGTVRGGLVFLAFFFLCAVGGAAAQSLFSGAGIPMVGASTAISGLLAGALYVMRGNMYGPLPALNSQEYLTALSPWVLINLIPVVLIALGVDLNGLLTGIAWIGHLGGLAAGALLFPLADRIAHGGPPRRPGQPPRLV